MLTAIKISFGFFWVLFFIYRLFFLPRNPYDILLNIVFFKLFLLLGVFIFLLVELFHIRKLLRGNTRGNPFTMYLAKAAQLILYTPLQSLTLFLLKFQFMHYFATFFFTGLLYINTRKRLLIVLILALIFPRLLLSVFLLIDISHHEINLMYKGIFLLVFPLLFHSIIYILKTYATSAKHQLEETTVTLIYVDNHPHIFKNASTLDAALWQHYYNILDIIIAFDYVKNQKEFLILRLFPVLLLLLGWGSYLSISFIHLYFKFYLYRSLKPLSRALLIPYVFKKK